MEKEIERLIELEEINLLNINEIDNVFNMNFTSINYIFHNLFKMYGKYPTIKLCKLYDYISLYFMVNGENEIDILYLLSLIKKYKLNNNELSMLFNKIDTNFSILYDKKSLKEIIKIINKKQGFDNYADVKSLFDLLFKNYSLDGIINNFGLIVSLIKIPFDFLFLFSYSVNKKTNLNDLLKIKALFPNCSFKFEQYLNEYLAKNSMSITKKNLLDSFKQSQDKCLLEKMRKKQKLHIYDLNLDFNVFNEFLVYYLNEENEDSIFYKFVNFYYNKKLEVVVELDNFSLDKYFLSLDKDEKNYILNSVDYLTMMFKLERKK